MRDKYFITKFPTYLSIYLVGHNQNRRHQRADGCISVHRSVDSFGMNMNAGAF